MEEKDLKSRHSVRAYSPQKLDADIISFIKSEITQASTREACVHFQLVCDDPDPFSGFFTSYGMFRNAQNYIACAVDTFYDNYLQKAGYYAEQIIMQASMRGLGTCIVGGTFDASKTKARLRAGWKIPFIILIGWPEKNNGTTVMSKLMHSVMKKGHPKPETLLAPDSMPWNEIIRNFPDLAAAVRSASYAPSALNKHPIKFKISELNGSPTAEAYTKEDTAYAKIDLGAAMWNWEAIAGGEWDFGEKPQWSPEIEF